MTHPAPYPPFALPQRPFHVSVGDVAPETGAVGHIVFVGEDPPPAAGLGSERLAALGFTGRVGGSLVLVTPEGPLTVLVGGGERADVDAAALRDAAAAFANATGGHDTLALVLPSTTVEAGEAASAVVEGAALARYTFRLGVNVEPSHLRALTLVCEAEAQAAAAAGAARGRVLVGAAELGRDLANMPGGILTATRLGQIATEVGAITGLEVQVFGEQELIEMGCGGLLAVNLGSVEPPVMVKLVYRPEGEPTGRLSLVGKGIMYDSGGLALKPGDEVHATMKNDMTGAGVILAAMTALRELGCRTQVTGFLSCTDNMPSGSALKLGDVITMRGGKTVEIINTDAEGRLVMGDALVLATEEPTDAIVDIATLTGACLRTFGTDIAGVMGNDDDVLQQVKDAGARVDEPVWELPLVRSYRSQLDTPIADLRNLGGPNAGSITAALFLEEFVAGTPWAHIDIAGTGQRGTASRWVNRGATGFGTRLLIDLALTFTHQH